MPKDIFNPSARARKEGYDVCFFDSLALPSPTLKIVDTRVKSVRYRDILTRKAGQFRIDIPSSKEDRNSLVLHLAKKIILRGQITTVSKRLEEQIKKEFGIEKYQVENVLKDEEKLEQFKNLTEILNSGYSDIVPLQWHDGSPREELDGMSPEEYFYHKILAPIVMKSGNKYIKCVIPQVHFSSFGPTDAKDDRRVDFLIDGGDEKRLVVEIDDETHAGHESNDEARDKFFKENKIEVVRVLANDLVQRGKTVQAFEEKIKEYSPFAKIVESENELVDYYKSIKLCHIFQTTILEIATRYDLRQKTVSLSDDCFYGLKPTVVKRILQMAIEDLESLCKNLSSLYGIDCQISGVAYVDDTKKADYVVSTNPVATKGINALFQEITFSSDYSNIRNVFPEAPFIKDPKIPVLEQLLEYIFGFSSFREKQIDGIIRALQGKDSIVLLPTGSGKSLVYQFLSFIRPGCVVVIEPLKSLMTDQVENLYIRGIDVVAALSSDLSDDEKEMVQRRFCEGCYSLMYLSPERIEIKGFGDSIKEAKENGVTFPICAIDEAHCVSEWGHDFRTSYLSIASRCRRYMQSKQGTVPVILALTGTASDKVLKDMEDDLEIDEYSVIRPKTFDRKELHFRIYSEPQDRKITRLRTALEDTIPKLLNKTSVDELLERCGDESTGGVVFCPYKSHKTRYGVDTVYNNLSDDESYSSRVVKYYGGVDSGVAKQTMMASAREFKDNLKNLIIATKAFGMGIDKPNIRYIIHYGTPGSIESYYQEVGRAGRDQKDAYGIIIYTNYDEDRDNNYVLMPINQIPNEKEAFRDDITTQIFLLKGNYETKIDLRANELLLTKIGRLERKKIAVTFSTSELYGVANGRKDEQLKNDFSKAIYRLKLLRIIKEYSVLKIGYDGRTTEYEMDINEFDKEAIIRAFGKYVERYQPGQEDVQMNRLRELQIPLEYDFVYIVLESLLTFQMETIGRNRLQAIGNMMRLANTASTFDDFDKQDEYIREEIRRYLSTENEKTLSVILNNPEGIMDSYKLLLKVVNGNANYSDILGEAKRQREDQASSPSLGLFTIMLDALSGGDPLTNAREMNVLIRNAVELYGMDETNFETVLERAIANAYIKAKDRELFFQFVYGVSVDRSESFNSNLVKDLPEKYVNKIVRNMFMNNVHDKLLKLKKEKFYG